MAVRQFYLTNANGETYNINTSNAFLTKIGGLGSEHNINYENVGNEFVAVQDKLRQKNITGELFLDTYEEYRKFVRFAEVKPLTLMYVTDDIYYIDVTLNKIDKSDKELGGLYCKIKLTAIGQYYKDYTESSTPDGTSGKQYNYKYPYKYTNAAASTINIVTESIMKAPVKLSIFGPSINPSWVHMVNDKLVATGKMNMTIPDGKKVVVDATRIPYSIKMMNRDNTDPEDVYQKSDFSTQRFVLLDKGSNTIRAVHETGEDIKIIVERRELYETV